MITIALILHSSNNDNLGVGALTVSEIEIIRSLANRLEIGIRIVVVDNLSDREPYVSGPDIQIVKIRFLRQPLSFLSVILRSDLVIDIGGGDSFSDIYGLRRFFIIFFMKLLVHFAERPLVLAPQTYGPFSRRLVSKLSLLTVRLSSLISTRDTDSLDYLRKLGFAGNVVDSSDVALKLPYASSSSSSESGRVKVGINISGLLMNGGYNRKNMFDLQFDYPSMMQNVIQRFTTCSEPCDVWLVPHVVSLQRGALEDDYAACLRFAERFPDAKVAPDFRSPSEAKGFISNLDFFLGSRMHACVAAFSTGVPVVPIAYSRKFSGLFGSLGYTETIDCTSVGGDEVVRRIFDAFSRRDSIKSDQIKAFEFGLEKLGRYEAALGDLIVEARNGKV